MKTRQVVDQEDDFSRVVLIIEGRSPVEADGNVVWRRQMIQSRQEEALQHCLLCQEAVSPERGIVLSTLSTGIGMWYKSLLKLSDGQVILGSITVSGWSLPRT